MDFEDMESLHELLPGWKSVARQAKCSGLLQPCLGLKAHLWPQIGGGDL